MAGKTRFKFSPTFDKNWNHPRKGTSISGIGDAMRDVSDRIKDETKSLISRERALKESEVEAIKHGGLDRNAGARGSGYSRAKAEAFALKTAEQNVFAIMLGGEQMHAQVIMNRTGSASLEYGGTDSTEKIYESDQYVHHPAYAFLRRAAAKAAR
jgi:hypothetical protein